MLSDQRGEFDFGGIGAIFFASALRNGDDHREEDRSGAEGRALASHVA